MINAGYSIMLALILALILALAPGSAEAQFPGTEGSSPASSPSKKAPAERTQSRRPKGAKVGISTKDCRRLLKRNARVGAGYRAGVDSRGKKVKSADLAGSQKLNLPEELSFNVGPDIRNYMSDPGNLSEMSAKVGTVKFNLNTGKMTFNGQTLSDPMQADMVAKCRRALGVR